MNVFDKFLNAIRLNDDFDEDDEYFEDEPVEETPKKTKEKKSFFAKKQDFEDDLDDLDDFDDLDDDYLDVSQKLDSKPVSSTKTSKPAKSSSKITPIRTKKTGGSLPMEVCVIKPTKMDDTREIADSLIDHCTVVLNLEGIDVEVAQRIIDFASGACYSIGGSLQKVSGYIFILTPDNVELSGDFQKILNGFDVPSIRTEF